MRTLIVFVLLLSLAGVGGVYFATQSTAETPSFRTVNVQRGDLLATISATGTVEPEEVVDVGAQVVGRIKSLGIDPSDPDQKKRIDYGSVVHEGSELAYIDDAVYQAQVDQAQAGLLRAEADLLQAEAKQSQAERDWLRAQQLRPDLANPGSAKTPEFKALSDAEFDLAKANSTAAKANIEVVKATIKQAEAALRLATTNLNYTVIKSPVEGVIVDRRVNVGQTVVASLNAPSLFLIAKDLRRMQVWASVNEADIGRVRSQMPVRFTVDAYPGKTFHGTVEQVRLNATMTQNVVTYTVVVATDNSDGLLKPYLTASLLFEVEQHKDVHTVPNGALRWRPRKELIAPEFRDAAGGKDGGKGSGSGRSGKEREERNRLWVRDGEYVRPVQVQVGPTDGAVTVVSGEGIDDDLEVVVGEIRKEAGGDTTNPFAPRMFGGGQRNGQRNQ